MKKAKTLEELRNDSKRILDFISDDESDVICVLAGTAFIDAMLESLLRKKFCMDGDVGENLLNPIGGALGSFKSRSDLCYCLGIISSESHKDLVTIGRVRNKFAHNYMNIEFNEPEIKKECDKLESWRRKSFASQELSTEIVPKVFLEQSQRYKFIHSILNLYIWLQIEEKLMKSKKPE